MKALNIIKKVLIVGIGVIYFAFALVMTILLLNRNDFGVTQFGDNSWIMLADKVSSEEFKKGDLVIVERATIEEFQKGETAFAYKVDSKGVAHVTLGVVGEVYPDEEAISYENGETYSLEYVIGKSTKVYNNIGTYLSVILSQWGFLFIILVPCFLLFIYQVYALIVEIKYGEEDDYYY